MEQIPSQEVNRFLISQEIPAFLETKFHFRINKSPPPVLIVSQINPERARIPRLEDIL